VVKSDKFRNSSIFAKMIKNINKKILAGAIRQIGW
jgi:hypothetical protein